MKKWIALGLCLMMVLLMSSCAKEPAATEPTDVTQATDITQATDAAQATTATQTPTATEESVETQPEISPADLKLGFILGSRDHAFYCSVEEGILAAAADLGFQPVVLESNLDGVIASERIETLLRSGCDAIALSVNDPDKSTAAIEAADVEGIPMFAFDCTSDKTDVIKCFVGTDNFQGGALGGEMTIRYLEENGLTDGATIGIITHPDPQSCIDRESGWYSVIEKYEDQYNLTVFNIGSYLGEASVAEELMKDALSVYPDMACIFTVGDPACIGAMKAIKEAGSSCAMIGFDANPEAHEAILDEEDGKIWVADVAQDPYQIGYKIAEEMVSYCVNGEVTRQTILVPPYLVDASNASLG